MKALIEVAMLVHPATALRVLVPIDVDHTNVVEAMCIGISYRLVAESNIIVDMTNERYIKNRANDTTSVSPDALDVFKCFPLVSVETLKRDYKVTHDQ
jgi:hypothetical protein